MPHTFMPVSLSLKGRSCLVVGGGTVALRKVETLLEYDTTITLIAPDIEPQLAYLASKGLIKFESREYKSPEAAAYGLVIAATDNNELNTQIAEDARGAGVLVNVVDKPSQCDFIFPSLVRRDCLTVSVSTDGKAPFMSANLRVILENIFPKHWERIMSLAADFRKMVTSRWQDDSVRKADCYQRFVQTDWSTLLNEHNNAEIREELSKMIESDSTE